MLGGRDGPCCAPCRGALAADHGAADEVDDRLCGSAGREHLRDAQALELGDVLGWDRAADGDHDVIDTLLARFTDAVLAFPYVVLAIALAAVFGPSLTIIMVMVTFFSWAGIARIVRGQTLSIKEKEYIEAARSLGAGPFRIMFLDILPNLLAPVLVIATLYIPSAIVFESTLSFLGLGIQPPTPSWGNMLADASNFYQVAWWYLLFPALFLLITTLAFNLLGDGIRDAMDPRTERVMRGVRRKRRKKTALIDNVPGVTAAGGN